MLQLQRGRHFTNWCTKPLKDKYKKLKNPKDIFKRKENGLIVETQGTSWMTQRALEVKNMMRSKCSTCVWWPMMLNLPPSSARNNILNEILDFNYPYITKDDIKEALLNILFKLHKNVQSSIKGLSTSQRRKG